MHTRKERQADPGPEAMPNQASSVCGELGTNLEKGKIEEKLFVQLLVKDKMVATL